MWLISHRGHLNGPNDEQIENHPSYIDQVIERGFHCEIDLWRINKTLYLGHDLYKIYEIRENWLFDNIRSKSLLVHAKNATALDYITDTNLHFFWHELDSYTLSNRAIPIVYPGRCPVKNSILMKAEYFSEIPNNVVAICSDFIANWKE